MVNLDIQRAVRRDAILLRRLYELYCHDFSPYTHADVGDDGLYTGDDFLADHWPDRNWSAWLFRLDGKLAGFAWLHGGSLFRPQDSQTSQLAEAGLLNGAHLLVEEFFVMRKYRNRGVGAAAARWLFDRFDGVWEVSEMAENTPAQAFWRKVIDRHTGGKYLEIELDTEMWHGPVQVFRNPANHSDSRDPRDSRGPANAMAE